MRSCRIEPSALRTAERLICSYTMHLGQALISVSLATVELRAELGREPAGSR